MPSPEVFHRSPSSASNVPGRRSLTLSGSPASAITAFEPTADLTRQTSKNRPAVDPSRRAADPSRRWIAPLLQGLAGLPARAGGIEKNPDLGVELVGAERLLEKRYAGLV